MKRCLVDVNVLLALLARKHLHNQIAKSWFDRLRPGEAGVCRAVQLSVIRLFANPAIMAEHALPPAISWEMLSELMKDERLEFALEPSLVENFLPAFLRAGPPNSALVADAYLAAFAVAADYRFVTLDRGFHRFSGLDLELLASH
jgi:toxin-antitoxin system PIN domain toxin